MEGGNKGTTQQKVEPAHFKNFEWGRLSSSNNNQWLFKILPFDSSEMGNEGTITATTKNAYFHSFVKSVFPFFL